jgi:cytochrome c-type biogenesis protein CcsB
MKMKYITKGINILISTRLTAFLFLFFGATMGIATFIENDFSTQTARALVYNTWWFNSILLLFVINFIGNIKRYRLFKKDKLSMLVLHLAFIVIIVGAAITRYISFEAIMIITEGETTSRMLSDKNYLTVLVEDNLSEKSLEIPLLLAEDADSKKSTLATLASVLNTLRGRNYFKIDNTFKQKSFSIEYSSFIANAKVAFEPSTTGSNYLHFVESANGSRNDNYLEDGAYLSFTAADISFNNIKEGVINIYYRAGRLYIKSHRKIEYLTMASQETGILESMTETPLKIRTLYTIGSLQFVIPEPLLQGNLKYVAGDDKEKYPLDALQVKIKVDNTEKEITLLGTKFSAGDTKQITINNLRFNLRYGSKYRELPFSVKLNDFILEKHPGSESPKSFISKITVKDNSTGFDSDIFMNNVLDHKGYRFFQSSYTINGNIEQSILSVNHDRLGTWVTYIGYAFLFFGLIIMLISPSSYFGKQRKRLAKMSVKNTLSILFLCFGSMAFSQSNMDDQDAISFTKKIPIEHADAFGKLIVQDDGGRMKPINTYGSELLRKLSKKDNFRGLSSNQVILSLFVRPDLWENTPIVYMKKDNTKVRDLLGISHNQKTAKLTDFFTAERTYKLLEDVTLASKQKIKNKYQQSILSIDGRLGLLYIAIQGGVFKILPISKDQNNTWVTINGAKKRDFIDPNLGRMGIVVTQYKKAVQESIASKDFSQSDALLKEIKNYQSEVGVAVMPSQKKVNLEVWYNKYDVFKNLFWQYLLASLLLFILVITQIFKDKSKFFSRLVKISTSIAVLLFIYHTTGLGIRWYISGHAPWSNGYESMIYVSWATLFFGLVLGKKSPLTIAATTFVSAMILMIAHWNWMDPSIGNLVPVLDSYWLMIHVAIIVASYGPFAIGMILGLINLILFTLTNSKNKVKLNRVISELTIINELALTIGLVMLTIGNFLGGIWANESWGRYWGWDPKETWALISIMVYAFVIHMRMVPGLRGKLTFNIISVFAFTSILMTYLGVNHLLSGLHSYATGDAAPIPNEIWAWLIVSTMLSILAFVKNKKVNK